VNKCTNAETRELESCSNVPVPTLSNGTMNETCICETTKPLDGSESQINESQETHEHKAQAQNEQNEANKQQTENCNAPNSKFKSHEPEKHEAQYKQAKGGSRGKRKSKAKSNENISQNELNKLPRNDAIISSESATIETKPPKNLTKFNGKESTIKDFLTELNKKNTNTAHPKRIEVINDIRSCLNLTTEETSPNLLEFEPTSKPIPAQTAILLTSQNECRR